MPQQHGQRKDDPTAVLVGPDPQEQPDQRPVRIGVPTSRPNWVSFSPSSALICDPDDRENRPDREADGEGDRA